MDKIFFLDCEYQLVATRGSNPFFCEYSSKKFLLLSIVLQDAIKILNTNNNLYYNQRTHLNFEGDIYPNEYQERDQVELLKYLPHGVAKFLWLPKIIVNFLILLSFH